MKTSELLEKLRQQATVIDDLQQSQEELLQSQEELLHKNRWLTEQLETLLRRIYGRKSERFDPDQGQLFSSLAAEPQADESALATPAPKPKLKGHGRKAFPKHLPRDTKRYTLPEEEQCCPDCGEPMKEIGAEISERGHVLRPQLLVRRTERVKYACSKGHAIKVAQAPPPLLDRCKYEPSVYAHVAVAKYCDHLPLNRQSAIFKRYGFDLSKSTMWDMLVRIQEIAARPILEQMHKELLLERILQADETPTPVIVEGKKGSKTGYIWTWRRKRKVLFRFSESRNRDGPKRFLGDWKGTLLTDGYSVYDSIAQQNRIRRAGCWVHSRRKFEEALDGKVTAVIPMLRLIQRLFWLESAIHQRVSTQSLTEIDAIELCRGVRAHRSRRVLEQIEQEGNRLRQIRATLQQSKLGKALTYLENQRLPLQEFVEDPELPIENNASERALRHVILGRNNWQFFASPRGGEVAADLYSLIYSCKAIGVDPEAYLEDVLQAVASTPSSQIATLTPWAWAEQHPEHQVSEPHVDR